MKPELLFVKPSESTFMQVDESILNCKYATQTICLNQNQGRIAYLNGLVRLKLGILWKPSLKLVVIWFADYHAALAVFFARLMHKKSIVLIGGYDAVHYPEFAYGVFHTPLRRFCAVFALKHANLIVANHEALLSSNNSYYNAHGHPEGIFKLIPSLKTPAVVIHNSILAQKPVLESSNRRNGILCVGTTPRYADIFNKGYDLILKLAAQRPDWHFTIVGIQKNWMEALERDFGISKLSNVRIIDALPYKKLLATMSASSIYLQPSISEGMPNALMEAMLCGCIPVGSNVAGIPTIIADQGFVFNSRTVEALQTAIEQAMKLEPNRSGIAESIIERFSYAKRSDAMLEAVKKVLLG